MKQSCNTGVVQNRRVILMYNIEVSPSPKFSNSKSLQQMVIVVYYSCSTQWLVIPVYYMKASTLLKANTDREVQSISKGV